MRPRAAKAWASLRHEWAEAPWFVLLTIGVTAFLVVEVATRTIF